MFHYHHHHRAQWSQWTSISLRMYCITLPVNESCQSNSTIESSSPNSSDRTGQDGNYISEARYYARTVCAIRQILNLWTYSLSESPGVAIVPNSIGLNFSNNFRSYTHTHCVQLIKHVTTITTNIKFKSTSN